MVEKIKGINNPLTIIAIFAALAEVSATVSVALIDKSLQSVFIWFLIGFPSMLVILFFITLNFNTKVMYSPSDYKDEKDFVKVLFPNTVSGDLDNLNSKVKTIIGSKNYEELSQIPDDIEKIKAKAQQIPINNAWDLNHWRSNYASIEGDKIVFLGLSPKYKEDGCNKLIFWIFLKLVKYMRSHVLQNQFLTQLVDSSYGATTRQVNRMEYQRIQILRYLLKMEKELK